MNDSVAPFFNPGQSGFYSLAIGLRSRATLVFPFPCLQPTQLQTGLIFPQYETALAIFRLWDRFLIHSGSQLFLPFLNNGSVSMKDSHLTPLIHALSGTESTALLPIPVSSLSHLNLRTRPNQTGLHKKRNTHRKANRDKQSPPGFISLLTRLAQGCLCPFNSEQASVGHRDVRFGLGIENPDGTAKTKESPCC